MPVGFFLYLEGGTQTETVLSNSLLQAPIQTPSEGLSVLHRYVGNVVSACTWMSTHRFFILLLLLCLGFLVSSYNVSDLMLDLSLRHFYFSFAAPCDIKQTQLPKIWLKKKQNTVICQSRP